MHPHRANSLLRKLFCTLLLTSLLTAAIGINAHTYGEMPQLEETASSGKLQLVVKVSPHAAYQTEAIFVDKKLQRELEDGDTGAPFVAPLLPDTTLSFDKKGVQQSYGVTPNGEVVDLSARLTLNISSAAQNTLRSQVQVVRAKHYGEILPWEEASEVLPKYSKFTIVDVESGLSFEGQRRAGSHHADVQPLTKADSATLKAIYGGAWSWDRKAVLVKLNGRTLAGSMHGMPHGGDGIPGNDFNGHFCIHFLGSVTHGSRSVDPAHQVMVHRAAGLLTEYISKLSPWALIDVWISAANQGDLQLLQVTTGQEQAVHVRSMRRLSKFPERDVSQLLQLDTAVDVSATPMRASAVVNRRVLFRLERASLDERWYIRSAVIQ
ncbi:hypothetical protein M5X11_33915 [Paenibacillus alginolyticus]|uniref:Uncharacterized protein n=1 Tax=Paenibacillus alginolyticus TaxID=59839 RepID=A0ABT4GJ30_9BACL|nr:hypothetical protein [Paenibacillus alginolyticus]MCY9669851.1 hypothetical protein [Paenibacillus alginolyticus]MCY9696203.1 hypothetical protein [Paenibacillus alginolyticus]MEC0142479.1 hypothetical protein [Paenibacillus alginolyticus]